MNGSRNQTLPDICTDLFSFVVYLREAGDLEQPPALYDKLISLFASMEEKARNSGVSDVDILDAKYALAAFADETIGWESRLELEYFSSNVAGEEFFNRLERIKKDKGRDGVLEVYYLCVSLGFEGRYIRAPQRLREYAAEFRQFLESREMEELSPHGERPKERTQRRRGGVPAWVPWAVTGVGVVAVGLVFALLKVRIVDWAAGVVNQIEILLR